MLRLSIRILITFWGMAIAEIAFAGHELLAQKISDSPISFIFQPVGTELAFGGHDHGVGDGLRQRFSCS